MCPLVLSVCLSVIMSVCLSLCLWHACHTDSDMLAAANEYEREWNINYDKQELNDRASVVGVWQITT